MTDRSEILFLSLTRPALTLGVPLEGLMLNTAVVFFGGMVFSGPSILRSPFVLWSLWIPVHFVMRRVTTWDYHGFRTIVLWLLTSGLGRVVLEVMPTGAPKTSRDIPTSG